ncbi:MAG: hypothetical protein RIR26_582 [Pseudomonadota bacterium]
MEERGVDVDHSTIHRWVLKYAPELEEEFRKRKKPVGPSWRVDETHVKVKVHWKYLYKAVDKDGATIDFLLTEKRNVEAAKRFFRKSIHSSGMAEKVPVDKSGANKAPAESFNTERRRRKKKKIVKRQIKYLNNVVEQDHRANKRVIRPMLGFKSFRSATKTISGIEIMHMIRKEQMADSRNLTHSEQFYSLAG